MQAPLQPSARGDAGTTTVERAETRPGEAVQTSKTPQEPDVGREVAELAFLAGFLLVLVWLAGVLL